MKVSFLTNFESILPEFHLLIESPLKALHFHAFHTTDFANPILRTAEKIFIRSYGYNEPNLWLETHRNLPNKEVIINTVIRASADISILELIEYWRGTRRAIGSHFSVLRPFHYSIETFLESVKERFQGTYVKLEETETKSNPNNNAVSVKIDSESEIVIHGISSRWAFPKIVMKVVAVGSSANISKAVVGQNLAHKKLSDSEDSKKSNIIPRKSSEYSGIFFISLLAILVVLCLWFLCY
ncbi:hypothetical protein B9Z55_007006 [Caenorhabditis nigoni]|nr:hypothetical protein B9Z55_007006 [Caenorhabditis nigoni]